MPVTLPILCVRSVSGTSKLLADVFGWRPAHEGEEFGELYDERNERTLWLHAIDAHEHARFQDNHLGGFGRGFALYVFVTDIDAVYARVKERSLPLLEDIAVNPNAGFREFTFVEENGYKFSVAEPPSWQS
jgi:hypothetical protein